MTKNSSTLEWAGAILIVAVLLAAVVMAWGWLVMLVLGNLALATGWDCAISYTASVWLVVVVGLLFGPTRTVVSSVKK